MENISLHAYPFFSFHFLVSGGRTQPNLAKPASCPLKSNLLLQTLLLFVGFGGWKLQIFFNATESQIYLFLMLVSALQKPCRQQLCSCVQSQPDFVQQLCFCNDDTEVTEDTRGSQ